MKTEIEAEWKKKIEADPSLKPSDYLPFRNKCLDVRLKNETPDVKDDVETLRNLKPSKDTVTSLLHPHEEDLPDNQKEMIVEYRSVQR